MVWESGIGDGGFGGLLNVGCGELTGEGGVLAAVGFGFGSSSFARVDRLCLTVLSLFLFVYEVLTQLWLLLFTPSCIPSIFSTCDTRLSSCFSQTYSLFDASSTAIAFRFQPQADKRKMKESIEGFCQENTCREIQTFSHTTVQNLCVGWII